NELLDAGHRGSHLRHALLSGHYRQPLQWTDTLIAQSQRTVDRWRGKMAARRRDARKLPKKGLAHSSVVEALQDDLNTPVALAALGALLDG
ncbi:hypothetical protein, partial [Pseudomonas aeruginosa]|uniref:hypothetical protein n=1 Tax=Pseudomonas aeruginosa TaxID=287 RepID=UPI002886BAC5